MEVAMTSVTLPSCLYLLLWVFFTTQFSRGEDTMQLGSSLSPSSTPLLSSSSAFLLSFRPAPASATANASRSPSLYLAISFAVAQKGPPAWVANRDASAVSSKANLTLLPNGVLSLSDSSVSRFPIWSSPTANVGVVRAQLLDSGNLVLLNNDDEYMWQSFEVPTDTLLPSQTFTADSHPLTSSARIGHFERGNYILSFLSSAALQLSSNSQPGYWKDWDQVSSFWFDLVGSDIILHSSSSSIIQTLHSVVVNGSSALRLTIDVDGNLRMYMWDTTLTQWKSIWMAFDDVCSRVAELCGSYGVCMYTPQPTCLCPQGFTVKDPTLLSAGCRRNYAIYNCSTPIKYVEIEGVDFPSNDLFDLQNLSMAQCKAWCSLFCKCRAAVFWQAEGYGHCWLKEIVKNGLYKASQQHRVFLKLSANDPSAVSPILDTAATWSSQILFQPQ